MSKRQKGKRNHLGHPSPAVIMSPPFTDFRRARTWCTVYPWRVFEQLLPWLCLRIKAEVQWKKQTTSKPKNIYSNANFLYLYPECITGKGLVSQFWSQRQEHAKAFVADSGSRSNEELFKSLSKNSMGEDEQNSSPSVQSLWRAGPPHSACRPANCIFSLHHCSLNSTITPLTYWQQH